MLLPPVPSCAVGGAAGEWPQNTDKIKKEDKEELIPTPDAAPPGGLTVARNDDTAPELELKILEYHSEKYADISTQTDSKEGLPFTSVPLSTSVMQSIVRPVSSTPSVSSHAQCPNKDPTSLDKTNDPTTIQRPNPPECQTSLRHHTASHSTEEVVMERVEQEERHICSTCGRAFYHSEVLKRHAKMHKAAKFSKTMNTNVSLQRAKSEASKKLESAMSSQKATEKDCGANPVLMEKTNGRRQTGQATSSFKDPQLTKRLVVTIYKDKNVENLLSKLIKSQSQNCTKKIQKMQQTKEEYRCPFCDKVFYTESSFTQHKFSHKDDYKCSVCSKRFRTGGSLYNHMLREHMQQNGETVKKLQLQQRQEKLKFERCNKDKMLKDHAKLYSEDGGHSSKGSVSPMCEVGFFTANMANYQLSNPENVKNIKDNQFGGCGMVSEAKSHVQEGPKEKEDQKQSPNPGKKRGSSDRSSADSSEPEQHYRKELPCPHCKKVYLSRPGFMRHLFSHRNDRTCPFCEQRFKQKRQRKRHILSQHIKSGDDQRGLKVVAPGRLYNCKSCPRSFWIKKAAILHQAFHQTTTRAKVKKEEKRKNKHVFRCKKCSVVFRQKSNWKNHQKEVHKRGL